MKSEGSAKPKCTVVIPVFNQEPTLERAVRSVLSQTGTDLSVVIADHGSSDGSTEKARTLAASDGRVSLLAITRSSDDRRTPAKPLNAGIDHVLDRTAQDTRHWIFRLDADDFLSNDDTLATQVSSGHYRALIMARLAFFSQGERYAYAFGPRSDRLSLEDLATKEVYAVVHHASGMRVDLVRRVRERGPLYNEMLVTAEDLDLTCKILREIRDTPSAFSFVTSLYCYKTLGEATATSAISLLDSLWSHFYIWRHYPVSSRVLMRGYVEAVATRFVGERTARETLALLLGSNGEFQYINYLMVERRATELTAGAPGQG